VFNGDDIISCFKENVYKFTQIMLFFVFALMISVMLILAIYTTAGPMMFTACNRVSEDEKSNKFKAAAIVTAIVNIMILIGGIKCIILN